MLLGELLDLAAVDVDLSDETDGAFLLGLLEECGCGVELSVGRGDALGCGDDLEISAADGEDDGVLGVACGELGGSVQVFGRAEVVPGGEIDDGLGDVAAEVDVVERADDGGEGEAGDGDVDADSFGGEVDLLQVFGEVAADVGEESAAGDFRLALSLADGVIEAGGAEVVAEAARRWHRGEKACHEGTASGADCASCVGALNQHGGIDGGDAVGGAGDGRFYRGD